jgi:multiple sugar transport system substrate-binding protein
LWGTADEARVSQQAIDVYNNQQNNVHVTARAIPWEAYIDTLNTQSIAGQMPDCGMMMESGAASFAERGLLADMTPMYPPGDPQTPLPSLAFKSGNRTIGYSSANVQLMLYYNRDMFRTANVPEPPKDLNQAWTWDQFVDVAKRLTRDVNGRTPNDAGFDRNRIVQYGVMVENLTWQLELWALSNGGGFFSPDGKEVWFDRPQTIEAIQRVADLHLVHNVAPLSAGNTDDGVQRSLIARTAAMTTNGSWNIGTCLSSARDEGLNYNVGVLPHMGTKLTLNTGGPLVVFSQSRHQKEAMDFLRWYSRAESDATWGLITAGIWMPTQGSWFSDMAKVREWATSPAYPPFDDFYNAVVKNALTNARPAAWYYTPNTDAVYALLGSVLGPVWTGQQTAQQAITANIAALRRAHAGN